MAITLTLRAKLSANKLSADLINAVLQSLSAELDAGSVTVEKLAAAPALHLAAVDSLADLADVDVSTLSSVDGFYLAVKGSASAYDGSGGVWVYEATATDTVNGTSVIAPTVGAGRWKLVTSAVEGIPNGSVTAAKLAADAVETAKIQNGAVTAAKLATDAVETAKIKDGAVTMDKLSAAVQAAIGGTVFDSGWVRPTGWASGNYNVAHGLAATPKKVQVMLRLYSTVGLFSAGDVLDITQVQRVVDASPLSTLTTGVVVCANGTNVVLRAITGRVGGVTSDQKYLPDNYDGVDSVSAITLADHDIRVIAQL